MRLSFLVCLIFICNTIFASDNVTISTQKRSGNRNITYEIESTIRSPMQTLGKNAFWGGGLGLLIGFAGHMLLKPDDVGGIYKTAFSLGVFGGSAYGIYDILNREDFYVSTSVKGKITDKEAFEKSKEKQVYATVRKRLDSPLKYAFNDSLWGGTWGLLMATAIIWSTDTKENSAQEDIYRFGVGGGILLGLSSSIVYNLIQRKKINDLNSSVAQKSFLTYFDPHHSSWNLAVKINF